ncbi:MAG: hypothetical protein K2N48_03095, partial [Muribaculaceae bacterium]|nr:hypothetical protein [Muribaculaceae bacterium]
MTAYSFGFYPKSRPYSFGFYLKYINYSFGFLQDIDYLCILKTQSIGYDISCKKHRYRTSEMEGISTPQAPAC